MVERYFLLKKLFFLSYLNRLQFILISWLGHNISKIICNKCLISFIKGSNIDILFGGGCLYLNLFISF